MRVNLMVEGQEGVAWGQWAALAAACEEHGLEGLFRSDHYAPIGSPPGTASLDAWATLAALAATTERIRLGTLVSPVTFRHPSVLAKMAVTVDHVSGGRVEVGIGAGWYPNDHFVYGFPFADTGTRMRMLAEQLEVLHRSFKEESFSFAGEHYTLEDCRAEPKPVQRPHLPVIVGGRGGPKSLELCAKWGDEYNTVFVGAERCREVRAALGAAFEREDRDPAGAHLSLMTGVVIGEDEDDVLRRAAAVVGKRGGGDDPAAFLQGIAGEWVTGTPDRVVARLQELEEAGVERVMLQHLAHGDLETVALLGTEVGPRVA
ncbi:MAG: TIGR03560 family F420-dependent LLM class oxidoreductase [Actinomycetota bacterium]